MKTYDLRDATMIQIAEPPPVGEPVDYARQTWEKWSLKLPPFTPDPRWPGLSDEAKAQTKRITALKAAYDEAGNEIARLDKTINEARANRPNVVRQAVAEGTTIPEDETMALTAALKAAQTEAQARRRALLSESTAAFDCYRATTKPVADAARGAITATMAEAQSLLDALTDTLAKLEPSLHAFTWATSGPSPRLKPSYSLGDVQVQVSDLKASIDRLGAP